MEPINLSKHPEALDAVLAVLEAQANLMNAKRNFKIADKQEDVARLELWNVIHNVLGVPEQGKYVIDCEDHENVMLRVQDERDDEAQNAGELFKKFMEAQR
jgi:hypothetical protein